MLAPAIQKKAFYFQPYSKSEKRASEWSSQVCSNQGICIDDVVEATKKIFQVKVIKGTMSRRKFPDDLFSLIRFDVTRSSQNISFERPFFLLCE